MKEKLTNILLARLNDHNTYGINSLITGKYSQININSRFKDIVFNEYDHAEFIMDIEDAFQIKIIDLPMWCKKPLFGKIQYHQESLSEYIDLIYNIIVNDYSNLGKFKNINSAQQGDAPETGSSE